MWNTWALKYLLFRGFRTQVHNHEVHGPLGKTEAGHLSRLQVKKGTSWAVLWRVLAMHAYLYLYLYLYIYIYIDIDMYECMYVCRK